MKMVLFVGYVISMFILKKKISCKPCSGIDNLIICLVRTPLASNSCETRCDGDVCARPLYFMSTVIFRQALMGLPRFYLIDHRNPKRYAMLLYEKKGERKIKRNICQMIIVQEL
jgi:hypothetical protein